MLAQFFANVVLPDDPFACWLWAARVSAKGYGMFWTGSHDARAHRVAFTWFKGRIPPELETDHECRTPPCVNPMHLRLLTLKHNHENYTGLQKNNTSGVRGVSWHKGHRRWRAIVSHNGRPHWGGEYAELADAEAAVVALRLALHTYNDLDRVSSG